MNSVLYVFLPCKKVYPTGITYLADFIHRRRPDVRQQILDLSLFPPDQRQARLREVTKAFQPELVCFSWRDIQIFPRMKAMPHSNMRLIFITPAIR
ncbi:MAG: hypothetical protein R3B95_12815 [Nitrospirales bacterium]|nr:hypothetical protein [Nitrospirales bacterium]